MASPGGPRTRSSDLLVTASFGRILRKGQLELFSPGRRLNVHPSLLPRYRGPAPIQHALLGGEKETGVCVIEMLKIKDGAVDSGDIWGCEKTVSERRNRFIIRNVYHGRLANPGWNHPEPITGRSGETGRSPSCLRPPTDAAFQGLLALSSPFPFSHLRASWKRHRSGFLRRD